MANNAILYLLCGKMAAGKSTRAAHLSDATGIAVLSEDKLLGGLYAGEITDVPSYLEYSKKLKPVIEEIVVDFLSRGTSLILDFPANTVAQRSWLVGLATKAGVRHELHFINVSDEICLAQLKKRQGESPERATTDTEEIFYAISRYFEPPSKEEGLNIVIVGS